MWDILGLDGPTDDVRAIKKAYAKRLRVTRPDDDPAAFMALRDALERAKLYAAYAHDGDDVFTAVINMADGVSVIPELDPLPANAVMDDTSDMSEPAQETPENPAHAPTRTSPVQGLIADVEALLKEPFARADKVQWRKIFDDERLDPIDNMIDFEDMLRNFLLDKFGYFDGDIKKSNLKRNPSLIPSRIGTLIFNMMGWREAHGRPLYVQDQIEWLKRDLNVLNQSRPQTAFQNKAAAPPDDGKGEEIYIFILVLFLVGVALGVKVVLNYTAGSGL